MKKIPVIMDVDTGIDDAVAIILAANSPELEILGITTVRGNNTIQHTTQNTIDVLSLLKKEDIPVYSDCETDMKNDAAETEDAETGSTQSTDIIETDSEEKTELVPTEEIPAPDEE